MSEDAGKRPAWLPETIDEAWEMPLEEVMDIPLDELFEGYEPVTAAEREDALASLGKPTGVGLQSGYADGNREMIEGLIAAQGDAVVKNEVNFRGLGILSVVRLGKVPDMAIYVLKAKVLGWRLESWDAGKKENHGWILLLFKKVSNGK